MTDRPILMSAPMVRAILDGRKTQTRRVLKAQPFKPPGRDSIFLGPPFAPMAFSGMHPTVGKCVSSPRFDVGDRLWVREAWRAPAIDDSFSPAEIGKHALDFGYLAPWSAVQFEADKARVNWKGIYGDPGRLRAGMHFPRWASRITLHVIDVRVQRVQEISEADAEAEGVFRHVAEHSLSKVFRSERGATAIRYFSQLWDEINAKRGFGWEANPWVVAITFRPVLQNIDAIAKADAHPLPPRKE